MMGFSVIGKIVEGRGVGRDLGAPTLNFDSRPEGLEFGVYAGFVEFDTAPATIEQKKYSAVAHWGPRLSFGETEPILEVHLLDFSGHVYGKVVRFEFLKKIRDVKAFESAEALKAQIALDVAEARKICLRARRLEGA